MPNPYHDEFGRFCSSDEMGAAVDRLAASGKFEEAYELAKEHTAASRAEMDSTLAEMKEFGVAVAPATKAPAASKTGAARGATATKVAVAKVPANPLALPKRHTYKPAGVSIGTGEGRYDRKFTGNKSGSWRSVTDIAKDVRSDLAEAQEKGYLPKGLKFSVTGDKYSGGQSMRVKIQGAKDKEIFATGDEYERPEFGNKIFTDEAVEVRERVQGIVDAYRWDASDVQTDYFSTNFYGFVDFETDRSAKWRQEEAERAKVKREGYKQRKDLLAAIDANSASVFAPSATPKRTSDGEGSFGIVPGTQLMVLQGTVTYPGTGRSFDVKEVYDLSGYTVKDGEGTLEDVVEAQDFFSLRVRLAKNKFYPAKVKRTRR